MIKKIYKIVNKFSKKFFNIPKLLKYFLLFIKKLIFVPIEKPRQSVPQSKDKDYIELHRKINNLSSQLNTIHSYILENFIFEHSLQKQISPFEIISRCKNIIINNNSVDTIYNLFDKSQKINQNISIDDKLAMADCLLLWGQFRSINTTKIILCYLTRKIPIFFADEGFIRSITPTPDTKYDDKYKQVFSYNFDYSSYYDVFNKTYFEELLNSEYELTNKEQERAQIALSKIIKNYLSKYNHQPIYWPSIGNYGCKKVLVIDQAFNDWSIARGAVTDGVFQKMLDDALAENPESDILLKIHPDMIANKHRGNAQTPLSHYNSESLKKVFLITEPINPICILSYVDKIYVCSSQMGFESLMLNKKTIIYGAPFYAGWGVGEVRNTSSMLKRRHKNRSVIEIFYFMYIKYTKYINPQTFQACQIEEFIDAMIHFRNQFFNKNNIRFDYEMKFPQTTTLLHK